MLQIFILILVQISYKGLKISQDNYFHQFIFTLQGIYFDQIDLNLKSQSLIKNNILSAMKSIYLLLPLLQTYASQPEKQLTTILNTNHENIVLHQIDSQKYALELISFRLGYKELTNILQQYQECKRKLSLIELQLSNYDWNTKENVVQDHNIESLMKKAIKYKQVKQQNKKLKKLLQNQLQNTQKVRQETQKTMKVLRQQFDALVRQMSKQSQKERYSSGINLLQKGQNNQFKHN